MLLCRAINTDDLESINNNHSIYSSLEYTYKNAEKKGIVSKIRNLKIYHRTCFYYNRACALDCVIGHIQGKRVEARKSPWISSTTDLGYAIEEYSIPQSGKYNYDDYNRKSVVIFEMDDNRVLSDVEEVKNLRNRKEENFAIDLRNYNLEKLFKGQAIRPEYENSYLPGFSYTRSGKYKSQRGFSNFATAAKEVLIYGKINKKDIKAILSPSLVDILYSCNIDMNKDKDFIFKNYKELNEYFSNIDNDFIGSNLLDLLLNNINNIPGNNIEDKYEFIKRLKRRFIIEEVKRINEKYNTSFIVSRLLDDNIYVKDFINIDDSININDLIIFTKGDLIYRFDHNKKGYYCKELDDIIYKKEINKMINKKVKEKGR